MGPDQRRLGLAVLDASGIESVALRTSARPQPSGLRQLVRVVCLLHLRQRDRLVLTLLLGRRPICCDARLYCLLPPERSLLGRRSATLPAQLPTFDPGRAVRSLRATKERAIAENELATKTELASAPVRTCRGT